MRLDFNVLWVDDQPDRIQAQIEAIERRMQAEGFQFNATLCNSIDAVRERITDSVFTDEIDLILVDWDLGGDTFGEDAIATARQEIPYKDVVFYSASNSSAALRELAFKADLEGVYCASREEIVDEVMGVFESLVKKVLDLDHTRGIVMGATSDIDDMVNQCLVAIHAKYDTDGQATMLIQALGYIERRLAELTELGERLKGSTTLAELFEAHVILTANDRLRILLGALKTDDMKEHRSYRRSVVKYQQKVVPGRNILGHLVSKKEGKPEAVIDNTNKPMSLEETRELRKLILELRSEFRNLLTALQGGS